MLRRACRAALLALLLARIGASQESAPIRNWTAPPYWTPPPGFTLVGSGESDQDQRRALSANSASNPLAFVAITPCRVGDTRAGSGFSGEYGPPSVQNLSSRTMAMAGQCGVPAGAVAVSLNVAATTLSSNGNLVVYPAGGAVPVVSSLNWTPSEIAISNAVVVGLGAGGAITMFHNGVGSVSVDLIVDVNGYYGGSVVTSVTAGSGLQGGGTGDIQLSIPPGGVLSSHLATGAVTSAALAANAVTAGAIAPGQVVKGINGAVDQVTVVGSGGTSVSTLGNTITVATPGVVPSGGFVLGVPGDTTLIGAGFTEIGPSNQDVWKPATTVSAPTARDLHTAIWTGSRMIIWGGFGGTNPLMTGAQYDPVGNSWTATATAGAPTGRYAHTAIWTGTRMIVWGGFDGVTRVFSGGQYDPVGNSWTATDTTTAPAGRSVHTAIWTGTKMIVWGGSALAGGYSNTGGQYDPVGDSWTQTTTTLAPVGRIAHSAVWTGSKMIIWGGIDNGLTNQNTGGLYDPVGDSWTATSTGGAPAPRVSHTAVWTASRMIVWGGSSSNTGSQYDPVGDSWTPTTTTGAPTGRSSHTAVWTGTKMIVWGGTDGAGGLFSTGGQYDPVGDSWAVTSATGAPTARYLDTAVWTGSRMILWGGSDGGSGYFNTGSHWILLSLYQKN